MTFYKIGAVLEVLEDEQVMGDTWVTKGQKYLVCNIILDERNGMHYYEMLDITTPMAPLLDRESKIDYSRPPMQGFPLISGFVDTFTFGQVGNVTIDASCLESSDQPEDLQELISQPGVMINRLAKPGKLLRLLPELIEHLDNPNHFQVH